MQRPTPQGHGVNSICTSPAVIYSIVCPPKCQSQNLSLNRCLGSVAVQSGSDSDGEPNLKRSDCTSRAMDSRQMRAPSVHSRSPCVVVRAMDLVVRCAVIAHHMWDAALEPSYRFPSPSPYLVPQTRRSAVACCCTCPGRRNRWRRACRQG